MGRPCRCCGKECEAFEASSGGQVNLVSSIQLDPYWKRQTYTIPEEAGLTAIDRNTMAILSKASFSRRFNEHPLPVINYWWPPRYGKYVQPNFTRSSLSATVYHLFRNTPGTFNHGDFVPPPYNPSANIITVDICKDISGQFIGGAGNEFSTLLYLSDLTQRHTLSFTRPLSSDSTSIIFDLYKNEEWELYPDFLPDDILGIEFEIYESSSGAMIYKDSKTVTPDYPSSAYGAKTVTFTWNKPEGYTDFIIKIKAKGNTNWRVRIPCPEIIRCDSRAVSGGAGITITDVQVGTAAGYIDFNYDAYYVPDRFIVSNGDEILFDTKQPVSGSNTVKLWKPYGPSKITVRVEGPEGTAWTFNVSCPKPEECDSETPSDLIPLAAGLSSGACPKLCAVASDEKGLIGPIPLPGGGQYLTEEECSKLLSPDSVAQISPSTGATRGAGGVPAIPSTNGGYFPRFVAYGSGNQSCGAFTHTNINEPNCYGLNVAGQLISRDPEYIQYFTSYEYPDEAGAVIFNYGMGLAANPNETPIRHIQVWGYKNLNDINPIKITEFRLNRDVANTNWCEKIQKPADIKYFVLFISENNPKQVRANVFANLSCLLEDDADNNLYQASDPNSIYQNKTINLPLGVSGLVDFYASIYMANDLFLACTDVTEPTLLPDPFKDLPRAEFQIIDNDTNAVLKEFSIDARKDLEVIPLANQLTSANTFVDKLETFFKEADINSVRIEVRYSRNTVFRWTMGCPKPTCFSFCGLTGSPAEIAVKLEADPYSFEIRDIGAQIWKTKGSSDGKSGPDAVGNSYLYWPIGYDVLAANPDIGRRYTKIGEEKYNALYSFPTKPYNGTFLLRRENDGSYKFAFQNPASCVGLPDATELVLKTGVYSGCGLYLNNFKSFYGWQLGKTNMRLTDFSCDDTVWDFENWKFKGHSCRSQAFTVGCDQLSGGVALGSLYILGGAYGNVPLAAGLTFGAGRGYTSIYDTPQANNPLYYNAEDIVTYFGIQPCDVSQDWLQEFYNTTCGYYAYGSLRFGGVGLYQSAVRSCFLDADDPNPRYQFPYTGSNFNTLKDYLKSFTREIGKPYIIVKEIKAIMP